MIGLSALTVDISRNQYHQSVPIQNRAQQITCWAFSFQECKNALMALKDLPQGLTPEKIKKASKLIYEYEDADWPPNAETEGANLQREDLVIRLFEILATEKN